MKNASRELLNQKKNNKDNLFTFGPSKNQSLYNNSINNKQNNLLNNDNNIEKKIIKNKNQFNNNPGVDPRLQLTFKYLDIEKILPIFYSNNINFSDLLLLSRKDLINLGLSMIDRNRILYFSKHFLKFGKTYTIEEINLFFQINKNLYTKTMANNAISNNKNINSENNSNKTNINNINNINNKNKKNENELFYYSNGFESNNINKISNDNEKDSQEEIDCCNIFSGERLSQSRTNTSSKNNINTSTNKAKYFIKYQELTQEVDNYMNKFNEYKQCWLDSKKKYDNLMSSHLMRGKTAKNKKNKKNYNNCSSDKIGKNKSIMEMESIEKLKLLKERKEELKKQLEKINDKSNHKKMIINYLDEN